MKYDKEKLLEQFKNYVYKYDINDENILRKYFHSIRVMNYSEQIAYSENLCENDIEISIVSGLLHDYARFEQWKNFHTYSDIESIDHGDLAIKLLFKDNQIKKYYNKINNYDEIYDSIKYHNKYYISSNISSHNYNICRIVRDADKIDIFNILIENKNMFLESEDDITSEVDKKFFECKNINYKDVKNRNDKIILTLSMIFDINFKYSYDYLIKNNILHRLFENIQNKEKFEKYFNFAEKYLLKNKNS